LTSALASGVEWEPTWVREAGIEARAKLERSRYIYTLARVCTDVLCNTVTPVILNEDRA
jgi:hypothetical protein